MTQRGIPELPHDPSMSPQVRRHLADMREVVKDLQTQLIALTPPTAPTNLVVTPQAFSNLVQWTRSIGADYFEVLWNTSASLATATAVQVGLSAQWTDNVGQVGITRFYWVRAVTNSGKRSVETGPKSGTTLASNAGVAPPTPPSQGQVIVTNQTTNRLEYQE